MRMAQGGGGAESDPAVADAGPNTDTDFQLREALNLLKGVNIVRNQGNG
ncbi:hypothetical protein N9H39_05940 [Gammaproteobacteria bacterium]|nr:hypothetical protein [Gammaproteobacteria bacterium]